MEIPEDISERLRSLTSSRTVLAITALSLFVLHFSLTWIHSGSFINHEWVGYYVHWYNMSSKGFLVSLLTQHNFHIGVPFFLKPLFDIAGTSPYILKGISVAFMALSSPILFLTYRLKYGNIRGLYTVLLLFPTWFWFYFHYNEWPIVLFTVSLLLYMFVRWYEHGNQRYLYYIAAVSGFFFYIKWIYAHVASTLFLSVLIIDRRRLFEELDLRKVSVLTALFLLGFSLVIFYHFGTDFRTLSRATPDSQIQTDNLSSKVLEISSERFRQLKDIVLRPVAPSLDHKNGLEIPVYMVLFITGLGYSLLKGERIYSLTVILIFLLLYYAPNGLNTGQMIVLTPFIPLIIGYNVEMIPSFDYRDQLILVMMILLVALSAVQATSVKKPDDPYYLDLSDHREFREKVGAPDTIFTNFIHSKLLAELHRESSRQSYIGPSDWRGVSIDWYRDRHDYHSVVLADEETCPDFKEGPDNRYIQCSMGTEEIWEKTELTREEGVKIKVGDYWYYVYHVAN